MHGVLMERTLPPPHSTIVASPIRLGQAGNPWTLSPSSECGPQSLLVSEVPWPAVNMCRSNCNHSATAALDHVSDPKDFWLEIWATKPGHRPRRGHRWFWDPCLQRATAGRGAWTLEELQRLDPSLYTVAQIAQVPFAYFLAASIGIVYVLGAPRVPGPVDICGCGR